MAKHRRNWRSDLQNKAFDYLKDFEDEFKGDSGSYFIDFVDMINDDFEDMISENERLESKISELQSYIEEMER